MPSLKNIKAFTNEKKKAIVAESQGEFGNEFGETYIRFYSIDSKNTLILRWVGIIGQEDFKNAHEISTMFLANGNTGYKYLISDMSKTEGYYLSKRDVEYLRDSYSKKLEKNGVDNLYLVMSKSEITEEIKGKIDSIRDGISITFEVFSTFEEATHFLLSPDEVIESIVFYSSDLIEEYNQRIDGMIASHEIERKNSQNLISELKGRVKKHQWIFITGTVVNIVVAVSIHYKSILSIFNKVISYAKYFF